MPSVVSQSLSKTYAPKARASLRGCPKLQERTPRQIASFLLKKYSKDGIGNTVKYFRQQGFTPKSLACDRNTLFKFLVLIAYDRRPFNPYEIVWDRDDPKSVFAVLSRKGLLNLETIEKMSQNKLDSLLKRCVARKNLRLDDVKKRGGGVKFARVIKEIAGKVDLVGGILRDARSGQDAETLHKKIDEIYGFGLTIAAKVVMYTVRGMRIGRVPISELGPVARHFRGEWHNSKWSRRLEDPSLGGRKGLLEEIEERLKDDPMAIDYFFYLDRYYCSKGKCEVCGL